jgi:hypothetical protein
MQKSRYLQRGFQMGIQILPDFHFMPDITSSHHIATFPFYLIARTDRQSERAEVAERRGFFDIAPGVLDIRAELRQGEFQQSPNLFC